MCLCTAAGDEVQPFGALLKRAIVNLIDQADDPMEREDRIQTALDAGYITYSDSYRMRCGDDL